MIKITLEAGRGAGKSFVATLIARHLAELGYTVNLDKTINPTSVEKPKGIGSILITEQELNGSIS